MKKKSNRITTIFGIIGAVGLALSSPEVRPLYDVTPPVAKQVGAVLALFGVAGGLTAAADKQD